jgi:hypothetical protein
MLANSVINETVTFPISSKYAPLPRHKLPSTIEHFLKFIVGHRRQDRTVATKLPREYQNAPNSTLGLPTMRPT